MRAFAQGAAVLAAARVAALKQDFARLMLGMFTASFPAYPLTFTYVGEAEAPQGKADVLDAKGGTTSRSGCSSTGRRTCRSW